MERKLDPHIARLMRALPSKKSDWDAMTAEKVRDMAPGLHKLNPLARKILDAFLRLIAGSRHKIKNYSSVCVYDQTMSGPAGALEIRSYFPLKSELLPTVAFFHGGGWVTGDLDQYDLICRMIATEMKSVVVSVGYRQPPEHKFPAAYADCLAAALWTYKNIDRFGGDRTRLALAGDSAGGNLAAAVSIEFRNRSIPLAGQFLAYPILDVSGDFGNKKEIFDKYPSRRENAGGYLITIENMIWHLNQYMPDAAGRKDPRISPLKAEDFHDLAPAVIFTAEFDPLRDDGAAYAKALEKASVPVYYHCGKGMIHGFFDWIRYSAEADRISHEFCRISAKLLYHRGGATQVR